ncbi:hypothetical protein ALI144C_18375 [Actinosynnema sp. ALI-1.44]|uniref:hemolysin family protein n=1 Tax=Actinosynnema sp. ALI-1.44 TaxID=1933779 RepID=UPI00097BF6A9|nr:hemolysin family protein [Actinosynnema sp. ALI-1.44]ONI83010.1 hypothetical protein ALI144C_18375 [Actinosynnema sp. ALI-1.44]
MSGLSTWLALLISVGAVALSAFFVAVEFALVAARQYRLEESAGSSLSARAALRSSRELSLVLAGSQLGITLCTLVLGAVSKPAVHNMMAPMVIGLGLSEVTADVISFVLALVVVTFVHLVVGEMAPKSWAIAHPELSATVLALPMRVFMWLTRPLLLGLNSMANWFLRRFGVEPVDEVSAGRGPDDLRQLLDHSAKAGALDDSRHEQLATALELNSRPLRDIVRPDPTSVAPDVTCAQIRAAARASGHLRLVVQSEGHPVGVVHVRDALLRPAATTAQALMRPVLTLDARTPIYAALSTMRETRNHLAVVKADDGIEGIVTLDDVLNQLLPVA